MSGGGLRGHIVECPEGHTRVYRLSDGRWSCRSCREKFGQRRSHYEPHEMTSFDRPNTDDDVEATAWRKRCPEGHVGLEFHSTTPTVRCRTCGDRYHRSEIVDVAKK